MHVWYGVVAHGDTMFHEALPQEHRSVQCMHVCACGPTCLRANHNLGAGATVALDGVWRWHVPRLMLLVVIANHFIACSWYALGESQPLEESWLSQLDPVESSMLYRYAVSFHWTMSQFTPAPNNFHPKNAEDRRGLSPTQTLGITTRYVASRSMCGTCRRL